MINKITSFVYIQYATKIWYMLNTLDVFLLLNGKIYQLQKLNVPERMFCTHFYKFFYTIFLSCIPLLHYTATFSKMGFLFYPLSYLPLLTSDRAFIRDMLNEKGSATQKSREII